MINIKIHPSLQTNNAYLLKETDKLPNPRKQSPSLLRQLRQIYTLIITALCFPHLTSANEQPDHCIKKAKYEAKRIYNMCLADQKDKEIEAIKKQMDKEIMTLKQKYEEQIRSLKQSQKNLRTQKDQNTKTVKSKNVRTDIQGNDQQSFQNSKSNSDLGELEDKYQITLKKVEISPRQNAKSVEIPDPIDLEAQPTLEE